MDRMQEIRRPPELNRKAGVPPELSCFRLIGIDETVQIVEIARYSHDNVIADNNGRHGGPVTKFYVGKLNFPFQRSVACIETEQVFELTEAPSRTLVRVVHRERSGSDPNREKCNTLWECCWGVYNRRWRDST
jgi:hypothetical protein